MLLNLARQTPDLTITLDRADQQLDLSSVDFQIDEVL